MATTEQTAAVRLACQWCEQEARYSINWECGHASAMCGECFAPSDDRDWTMDIMDWQQVPAICPDCATADLPTLEEMGFVPTRCTYDPTPLAGQPIGMLHCPECGCMQIAGLPHARWCDPDVCLLEAHR